MEPSEVRVKIIKPKTDIACRDDNYLWYLDSLLYHIVDKNIDDSFYVRLFYSPCQGALITRHRFTRRNRDGRFHIRCSQIIKSILALTLILLMDNLEGRARHSLLIWRRENRLTRRLGFVWSVWRCQHARFGSCLNSCYGEQEYRRHRYWCDWLCRNASSTSDDNGLYLNNGVRLISSSDNIIVAVMCHNSETVNCFVACALAIWQAKPRPSVCSVRISEAEARSGTIV